MMMNESDFSYTLYRPANGNTTGFYELQVRTLFEEENYIKGQSEILQLPTNSTGVLKLKLRLDDGGDTEIIHNVNLGFVPDYTPQWVIDVEYIDSGGNVIRKKKKNTEQAEIEAEPRPWKKEIN